MIDIGSASDSSSGKSSVSRVQPAMEESLQDTSFASGTNSVNRPQGSGVAPPPPQIQFGSQPTTDTAPMSKAMLIGMTIAIVLPPALVIGMILGYLMAAQF
jgi:hypothetical protein